MFSPFMYCNCSLEYCNCNCNCWNIEDEILTYRTLYNSHTHSLADLCIGSFRPLIAIFQEIDKLIDCSQSPIFREIADVDRWVRRAAILVSWCERNWVEYKMPVGRGGGGHGRRETAPHPKLLTPSPRHTGILYSPQFRSHHETKMAARRTQRSTSNDVGHCSWLLFIKFQPFSLCWENFEELPVEN